MRLYILIFSAFLMASCGGSGNKPTVLPPADDLTKSAREFLSTKDPHREADIITYLKENNYSHKMIKAALVRSLQSYEGQPGMYFGLTINHNGKNFPFALYTPETLEPGKSYPLMVVLHGMGGNGDSTLKRWMPRLKKDYIIVCPSYPMGAWWTASGEKLVLRLIRHMKNLYPVNPNKVFLAGLSNGAVGAYTIGMFHADRFAGIIPIAGSISERYMHFLVNWKNTPSYIIHGKHDPIFPIQFSQRIKRILQDMNYPVTIRAHEEKGTAHGGHFLPASEVPAMVEWLDKQERQPNPPIIRMTREANHLDRIHWARVTKGIQLAALQIPGPEKEKLNIKDGKIAMLFATHKEKNYFEVMGRNVVEFELYLNEDLVDFDKPVQVTYQKIEEVGGKLIPGDQILKFNQKVEKDLTLLLTDFKRRRDPEQFYDSKITVSAEKKVQFASAS